MIPEINPEYIAEPGQVRRFRSKSVHSLLELRVDNIQEEFILKKLKESVFDQLVQSGMFTVETYHDHTGIHYQMSLDVRTPADYGKPRWENIK